MQQLENKIEHTIPSDERPRKGIPHVVHSHIDGPPFQESQLGWIPEIPSFSILPIFTNVKSSFSAAVVAFQQSLQEVHEY